MQKFSILLLLALFSASWASAQTDGREMFTINFSNLSKVDTFATTLSTPSMGNNQLWDLSSDFTINGLYDQVWTSVVPSTIQGSVGASFPTAKYATAEPTRNGNLEYSFYESHAQGTLFLGSYNPANPDPISVFYTKIRRYPKAIVYPAPSAIIDTTTYSLEHFASNCIQGQTIMDMVQVIRKATFVGDGQLTTAIGIFDNVVLLKEEFTMYSTQYFDPNSNGNFDSLLCSNTLYWISYRFIHKSTFSSQLLTVLHSEVLNTAAGTGDTATIDWGWYAAPQSPGIIGGSVTDSLDNPILSGIAWLYRHNSNFNRDERIGKTPLDGNGNYQFNDVPPGQYRVAIRPNFSMYPGAVTTYLGDFHKWGPSPPITTNGDTSGVDIELQFLSQATGSGSVSGKIDLLWESGKTGDPVPGIDIIVEKNPAGTPEVSTVSLDFPVGTYEVSDLAPGSYRLFVDVCGVPMASTYTFGITESGEQFGALDFTVSLDSIFADFPTGTLDLKEEKQLGLEVFPNPLSNNSLIRYQIESTAKVELKLMDLLGKQVGLLENSTKSAGFYSKKVNPDAFGLSPGIYLLSLQVGNTRQLQKVVVQ